MFAIAMTLMLFVLVSVAICLSGLHTRRHVLLNVGAIAGVGASAFMLTFIVIMLMFFLHVENWILDVIIEEIIKAGAVALVLSRARPISVIAVFAGIEVVVGKFFIPYWLDPSAVLVMVQDHGAYVLSVSTAAYGLHIATGFAYGALGPLRGVVAALGLHIVFNMLALQAERNVTVASGALLLLAAVIMIVISVVIRPLFQRITPASAIREP